MTVPTIKAIETHYKGYRFRSRLEARWAVFFDALGIKWEYEAEGYRLPSGAHYLPDFWLPTFGGGMYVEVKPIGGDLTKAYELAEASGKQVLLALGSPDTRVYDVIWYGSLEVWDEGREGYVDGPPGIQKVPGLINADQAWGEDRMFVFPGYEEDDGTVPESNYECLGQWYLDAIQASRSARFEHGERG